MEGYLIEVSDLEGFFLDAVEAIQSFERLPIAHPAVHQHAFHYKPRVLFQVNR